MGNTSPCCFSGSNTNAASLPANGSPSRVPSHSHEPSDTAESSSVQAMESILNIIQEENTTEQIDNIIEMMERWISKIKGREEEVSASSGVEILASTTRSASEVVEFVSTEAEKMSNLEIVSQLESVATRLLSKIGGSHYIFLGLSLVAYTLESYLTMKCNESTCMDLLEELLDLARDVKDFKEAVTGKSEKVHRAIHNIVVAAVTCRNYIAEKTINRYLEAGEMESQLQKTKEILQGLRNSLTLTVANSTAKDVRDMKSQIAKRPVPCPSKLLDFEPEGIEEQRASVTTKLDIGGSEQAIAVVIAGFGGIGKSTLAASVIQSLDLSEFKFSKVIIDEKKPDKRAHIVELQSEIIFHLTKDELHLQDPHQGRQSIQEAMARKCCFLYIDNVVDSYFIKELLPKELLPKDSYDTKERSAKNSQNQNSQMQKIKIRILITSRQNDLESVLNNIQNIKVQLHNVDKLSDENAKKVLRKIVLQSNEPAYEFDEETKLLDELAKACRSIPLLLSTFGNHLKDKREKGSYEKAIKALKEGKIDRYSRGEEALSETLMFVYDQIRDEEAQEAFLDICTYFHGWQCNVVADIVDSDTIATLQDKKLVNKSDMNAVIVHDILRLMAAKKAKDTRLMNYEEFLDINDDESKLKSVKGMVIVDRTFLATLKSRHLNAMRHSLRVLILGDWVRVDGPQCYRAFKKLRYLQVGDLKDFPFQDVSRMEKLSVFWNCSKPGMELAQLPSSLKHLNHQIPYRDCNEFPRLALKNLINLKSFIVEQKGSVRLPQGLKLPASLECLVLNSCEQLPETVGHLSSLQTLSLDKCDFKCLPQGFTKSDKLKYLSLQHCTNMISLPDNTFESLSSLIDLRLKECTRLEKLPADLGNLTALQMLDIQGCENLRELPENFGGLKSLKILLLNGCISLQRLPDSFGTLPLEYLNLESLASLKELPRSIGDLSCLKSLRLKSCHSLECVPNTFLQLTKLEALEVENCIQLGALPEHFEQLLSLEDIDITDCPLLTRLPDGFQALKTLKFMTLYNCKSLVNLPECFEMLFCLEQLNLACLFLSSLPDGLGKLKKLKILSLRRCRELQTLPQDFENLATLQILYLRLCPMLEGTAMDKIVKLQNCHHVYISKSTKLIERWNELKAENENLPMIVQTSGHLHKDGKEVDRARRVGLLCGEYIELNSATKELNHQSSMSIPNNTTIALISIQMDQSQLLQPTVDMAKERATKNCEGRLRIIYVYRRSDASNEEQETKKTLMTLPEGISYAIPSTDIRRLSLIGQAIFKNPNVFNDGIGSQLLCFMVDVKKDDEGHQILKDGKCVTKDEISEQSRERLPISENPEKEIEISDGIVDFINSICESKTQSLPEQCSPLPQEDMVGKLIQKLKNNKIYHFNDKKVKVDNLQGKTVAIILIDQNSPECIKLQQLYNDFKLKYSNFAAIWIPFPQEEDYGFGTYSRAIQCMPWLTLSDPKLIKIDDIKNKCPRVIIINSGGSIGHQNALSLLISWGTDACPFRKGSLSQHDLKSSLKILFDLTKIKGLELNHKVIFLYAEPPSQKMKMKCTLEKLVQIHGHGNYEIVYVGRFFADRRVGESLQKAYEDATESMNWTTLSFPDMMTFWYRCKHLSDEVVQEPNSASTLNRLMLDEERWLVVLDGSGMVTANGIDVVEMACELSDDKVDIRMKEELRESLKGGKCSEGVRTFFGDELYHPQHHHSLRPRWKGNRLYCDGCYLPRVWTSYGKRIYKCDDCDWDLCWDCWKAFVNEEMRR